MVVGAKLASLNEADLSTNDPLRRVKINQIGLTSFLRACSLISRPAEVRVRRMPLFYNLPSLIISLIIAFIRVYPSFLHRLRITAPTDNEFGMACQICLYCVCV